MKPPQATLLVVLAAALPALIGCPPPPPPDPCADSCATTVEGPGTYRIRYEDADGVEHSGNFQPDGVGFIGICGCARILGDPVLLIGPPDCALGYPNPQTLDLRPEVVSSIRIDGVTEPDEGRIQFTIDAIYQDEPTFGLYADDLYPDVFGDSSSVRMECDPAGNGRVYTIEYTATDDDGESCQGVIRVCVPPEPGGACIDDGPLYDSNTRPELDLSVSLTHSPAFPAVGDLVSYTATVTNHGSTFADRARLTMEPVFDIALHSFSGECQEQLIRGVACEFEGLAPGASLSYTMVVIPSSAGRHFASARVGENFSGFRDPDQANNNASDFVDVAVSGGADLRVVGTVSPTAVMVGEELTYTITVTNDGPEPASGVEIAARVSPAGAQFVSASTGCSGVDGRVTCAPATPGAGLDVGESATFSAVFRPTAVGNAIGTITATSATSDQNVANNAVFLSATVSAPPTGPTPPSGADLAVTVVDSPDPIVSGAPLVYTVTVTNNGPEAATAAVLTLTLPPMSETGPSTTTQGTLSAAGGTLTVMLGSLASGATATVTSTVFPFTLGINTAEASVTADQGDPDATNNSAMATTMVIQS